MTVDARITHLERPSVIVPEALKAQLEAPIQALISDVKLIGINADGDLDAAPASAIALLRYFPYDRYRGAFGGERLVSLLNEAPGLRLIQSHSAGVDSLLSPELAASACELCNCAPIHSVPMAETVLALMLATAKRLPFHLRNQAEHIWQRIPKDELRGSTVGIVGFGRIGAEVGRLCSAFGMRVIGMRRQAMTTPPQGIDRVIGKDELDSLLAVADWIVLTVPLNEGTKALLGARELALMKPNACLVNVARGDVVDETALVQALQSDQLAYACLDVFQEEPLPRGHPLWSLPNVVVTPHNSASSPHMETRVVEVFLENLTRLRDGRAFINIVDKSQYLAN